MIKILFSVISAILGKLIATFILKKTTKPPAKQVSVELANEVSKIQVEAARVATTKVEEKLHEADETHHAVVAKLDPSQLPANPKEADDAILARVRQINKRNKK